VLRAGVVRRGMRKNAWEQGIGSGGRERVEGGGGRKRSRRGGGIPVGSFSASSRHPSSSAFLSPFVIASKCSAWS
jgi:hypothetical protein